MIYLYHESFKFDASRSYPRKAASPGKASPGSPDRDQDRGLIAGFGGPTSETGKYDVGSQPHDSGTLDQRSESRRNPGSDTGTQTWPPNSTNGISEAKARARSWKASPGIWPSEIFLGWTDAGSTSKEALWSESKGAAGTILVASLGLQSEARRLCLLAGSGQRCPTFSRGVKKNCATWNSMKPSFSRTRLALACIPGWDEVGLRKASVLRSLLPANTMSDSTSPVGWLPCWGGRE
jgi:hypothetical protein